MSVKNLVISDFGAKPFVTDIEKATLANDTYRTALWTGKYFQVTLMSILPGDDIGLEIHPDTDQFLRVESGTGVAVMGPAKDNLTFRQPVFDGDAIIIPAGTWHDVINTGKTPLKIYSIYAPPHHPWGTIDKTKADAEKREMEEEKQAKKK